jgi:NhaP-type Na+/H+ or K+/H+ antiporter
MLVGAILSPTDPVIASSIVKGKFAELHVPIHIRTLLSAESGANDGFALPFILLSIFLLNGTPSFELQFCRTVILRKILLSIVVGLVLGYVARKALKAAEQMRLIDKESIVAFNFALALMTLGLTALIEISDMLTVFVLGVEFSWDGWFEDKIGDTEFQAVIDALFTFTFFILFGAVTPWIIFSSLGLRRLIGLSTCIMLFRRVPITMLLSTWIPQLKTGREALFVGWFGPMGVGALFYAWYCGLQHFNPLIMHIVWAVVLCSIVVHGATVPAFHIETLRQTFSMIPEDEEEALEVLTILITESSSTKISIEPPVFLEEPEGTCLPPGHDPEFPHSHAESRADP